jgi:hypothetical protein
MNNCPENIVAQTGIICREVIKMTVVGFCSSPDVFIAVVIFRGIRILRVL